MWTTVWVFSAHSTMNVNWWMCVKSGGNLKDKSTFRTLELYTGSLQLTHWKKYLLCEPFCRELLVRLIIQTFSFCECQYNIHVITGLRGFDKQNKTMNDGQRCCVCGRGIEFTSIQTDATDWINSCNDCFVLTHRFQMKPK